MNTAKGTIPKALKIKLQQEGTNNGVGESFGVMYYGSAAAGSVPFMWESQPGTPKHELTESSLPQLTPPPSYQQRTKKYNSSMQLINHHHHSSKRTGDGFLSKIFIPSYRKKSPATVHTASFSSSSSSSKPWFMSWHLNSWQSTPLSKRKVRQEKPAGGSPAPVRCLGGEFKKSYRISRMKKVIQWFERHGKTK